MYGNTAVTAVTLAIGVKGSKIDYFSHSVGTVHPRSGGGSGGMIVVAEVSQRFACMHLV